MSPDVEEFISVLKVMRAHLPGSRRHRHCVEFFDEMQKECAAEVDEALRLMHRADEGDATTSAIVAAIAPAWEFGSSLDDHEPKCQTCAARAAKRGKADSEASDKSGELYEPSAKPGSATALAWGALVGLSPSGEPVDLKAWRDATLIVLARAEGISDPVGAFRDAKRNLKGQRAFEEASNGEIHRRV